MQDYDAAGPLPPDIWVETYANGDTRVGLGKCFDQTGVRHLDAHHVTVGGKVIAVPFHIWNGSWLNPLTAPRVVRSPLELSTAKQMFRYGEPWPGARVAEAANYIFTGPGDSGGITKHMPDTGERPDIGLITDPSATYLRNGANRAGSLLAWAQGIASCPNKFRDEATGKPIDLLKYPGANQYSENKQGRPWLLRGPLVNGYPTYGDNWEPQQAHYPEVSYVAFMATLNPGFLVDLQYSANFTVLADGYVSGGRGIATIFGELRGIAWAFRNLFMAHTATKYAEDLGILPASCHPSSYWKTLLDNQLVYYKQYMLAPNNQTFRLVGGGNRFGPWQCDYMLMALAFGVLTGHDDWAPLFIWALKNAIDRTSGESGYPVGWGGAYYLNVLEWKQSADGSYDQNVFDALKPLDWASAFLFQVHDPNGAQPTPAQIATLKDDPLNGGKAMVGNEYLMNTRAVLIMAADVEKRGICTVRATYPALDKCIFNVTRMLTNYGACNARASVIVSDDSVSLPASQGGTFMNPSSLTLKVGDSRHITLTHDGDFDQAPQYSSSNAAGFAITPDTDPTGGVTVKCNKAGQSAIVMHAHGQTDILATCNVTGVLPLASQAGTFLQPDPAPAG